MNFLGHDGEDSLGLAAAYTAGSMSASDVAQWESAMADGASPQTRATADLEGALLRLTAHFEPIAPPPAAKFALLNSIAAPAGFQFRFAQDSPFQPTPLPGVHFRLLSRERGRMTCLLRLDPGVRLPAHSHGGVEECMVLEGSVMVGTTRMRAGDYQRAEADSEHVEQWTDTGALLYLSAPEDQSFRS